MSDVSLTKTRIRGGVWEGVLTARADRIDPPAVSVSLAGTEIGQAETSEINGHGGKWIIRAAIPPDVLSDGVQVFVLHQTGSQEVLAEFAVMTGEAVEEDLRVEIELLRAELDMLKRAFRRHCAESM